MKNILKLFIFATILFVNQQAKAQIKFGLKGGVGLSDINIKISGKDKGLIDEDLKTKNITAFQIGGVIDFTLSESMSLQSALLYSRKGFRTDEEDLETGEYDKYFFNYLEVPLHLVYKIDKFQVFMCCRLRKKCTRINLQLLTPKYRLALPFWNNAIS